MYFGFLRLNYVLRLMPAQAMNKPTQQNAGPFLERLIMNWSFRFVFMAQKPHKGGIIVPNSTKYAA